jgi:hypothetical protein
VALAHAECQNPDDALFHANPGPHVKAFRLYMESAWAMAGYHTIASSPGAATHWVTLTNQVLSTKGELFAHALAT